MAITDIQISEELETSAPSIKYRGDEGPKSPEEEMMMADALLKEEYEKYVYDLLEQRPEATPMSLDEFRRMVIGDMSGGQPLPQDPTKPVNPFQPKPTGPVLPDRQMAAYGGIMGVDGRRQYGIGSSLKKFVRKVIPNEVAEIAVKAAPFVAPFNPLAAGLMSGIGSFDQTGRIGSSLKSGLMNYGLGQGARYLGGADLQKGLNLRIGDGKGLSSFFSKPTGTNKRFFDDIFKSKTTSIPSDGVPDLSQKELLASGKKYFESPALQAKYGSVRDYQNFIASKQAPNLNLLDKAVSTFTNLSPLAKGAIGAGAVTALLNMGPEETVSEIMDRGEGLDLDSIRTEVTEAFKDPSGKKLASLRVKYPYLGTQASKNTAIMANGGRIGFNNGGGIMDLGGMEKDYRNTGGFVDIGEYEKKDDVPARLSVNEFVMTADAVRGMGDGDIDLGAKRMENLMGAMENKKGAQQMFDVSERLSEVV